MEPSLVNPHSSVMVRYQDGERDGWGGCDGGWKEIWPRGGERERLIDADKPLVPPFPPCFAPSGPQTHFPHSALWRPLEVWFVKFRGALNGDPFSERLSLLETPRRGHYDPSERIKTPFVRLKLTHARLLCFWKAGAWETVHKCAFSSRWLPGHLVSLQTLFPFKCASFLSLLHVPLVPFSPCRMQIFPLAQGMEKRGSSSKAQVQMNLGAVVFLLEGFRKMKDGECTQNAALCYRGLPVAQTLNPYEQKKKENAELRSWETGNRKDVNICPEPRTRGSLLFFFTLRWLTLTKCLTFNSEMRGKSHLWGENIDQTPKRAEQKWS